MEAFLQSFFLVLAGEMGDKTQLLALVLAARYRRPWVVMGGILVATVVNHGLSAWIGGLLSQYLSPLSLAWVLALSFFAFAAWVLVPDKAGELEDCGHWGAFLSTVVAFFLAEMGDKTQLATVALGARFSNIWLVTAGTTLGMMAANALAVFFGHRLLAKVPMQWVRAFASLLFLVSGCLTLLSVYY